MNWLPRGVDNIRANFHHDDQAAGSGDIEPKLIRPYAKTRIAGLHLRVPQHCRNAGQLYKVLPARRSRQIMDGHIIIARKNIRTQAGGVTLEIDCCQAVAITKRRNSYVVTLLPIVILRKLVQE